MWLQQGELYQRGLSIAGTKPTRVLRLEAALRQGSKQSTDGSIGILSHKWRERDSENVEDISYIDPDPELVSNKMGNPTSRRRGKNRPISGSLDRRVYGWHCHHAHAFPGGVNVHAGKGRLGGGTNVNVGGW